MQIIVIGFFVLLFFLFLFLGLSSENGAPLIIFAMIIALVLGSMLWTSPVEFKIGENATTYGETNSTITSNVYAPVSTSWTKPIATAFFIISLALFYIVVVN